MRNKDAYRQAVYLLLGAVAATLTTLTGSLWWLAVAIGGIILHLIFRDTMNVFQWFPFWGSSKRRLYWIVKNDATVMQAIIGSAHVYFNIHDEMDEQADYVEYFTGSGVAIRYKNWSFQVGFGRRLQASPWHRDLDVPVEEIKQGVDGVWEEEDVSAA
jgi:hypothetical protein